MKNLNLTIGQELTIDEICNEMGIESGLLSTNDIRKGEQTSVDNYDGEKGIGHNVSFELIDSSEELEAYEFTVKITEIFEI